MAENPNLNLNLAEQYTAESLAYSLYWESTSAARNQKYDVATYILERALQVYPNLENAQQMLQGLARLEKIQDPAVKKSELIRILSDPALSDRPKKFLEKYETAKGIKLTILGVPVLEKLERRYGISAYFKKTGPTERLKDETVKFLNILSHGSTQIAKSEYDRLLVLYPRSYIFRSLYIEHLIEHDHLGEADVAIEDFQTVTKNPLSELYRECLSKLQMAGISDYEKEMAKADLLIGIQMSNILRVVGFELRSESLGG